MQITATFPWSHRDVRSWAIKAVLSAKLAGLPVTWLAQLLTKAGDIELNPGPKVWTCELCKKRINKNQTSILCNADKNHWVHLKCSEIEIKNYSNTWICKQHEKKQRMQITKSIKPTWTCDVCDKQIKRNQTSIECNSADKHWIHLKCSEIKLKEYTQTWKCAKHKETISATQASNMNVATKKKNTSKNVTKPNKTKPKKSDIQRNMKTSAHKGAQGNSKNKENQNLNNSNKIRLKIIQFNANGIKSKEVELEQMARELKPDIICIQESKLKAEQAAPYIQGYTTEKVDRERMGGGVVTYINENIKYTRQKTLEARDEAQILRIQVHLQPKMSVVVSNLYLTPQHLPVQEDDNITTAYLTEAIKDGAIVASDINGHSQSWYEEDTSDHRGNLIEQLIEESETLIINENTPTRIPFNRGNNLAQPTAPDITAIPIHLAADTMWKTLPRMASDHLPIEITINSARNNKKEHKTFTNYKKADWSKFMEYIEQKIESYEETTNPHKLNKQITETIMEADKKFIPKGNIRTKSQPIPEPIRNKISQRNEMRANDPQNPEITNLNNQIKQEIRDHKTNIWKEKTSSEAWSKSNNQQIYWRTMKTLQGKQVITETNRTIDFQNKTAITDQQIANAFNKQYTGVAPKITTRQRRRTTRKIRNMQKEEINITEQEVKQAIRNAPNKKSAGPDGICVLHLKHLGPQAIKHLAKLFTYTINTNTIPQIWKTAKIIPIPKPNKDKNLGKSYRPISLLSNIAKTLERIILNRIQEYLPNKNYQHGYKKKHSTTTALQKITQTIADGFNQERPPKRTIMIAVDMSRAFDVVNHNQLIEKIINNTEMPNTYVKFLANYMQGRKAYTIYNTAKSKHRPFHAGVPQGGVLSPALFNLFMADIPEPRQNTGTDLVVYADDVTLTISHEKIHTAETAAQAYLDEIL